MPATLEVREDGRVLVFTLTDPWELSDLISLAMRSRIHMDRASEPVYRVYDLREAQQLPPGVSQAQGMIGFRHVKAGETVIVGTSPVASRFEGDKRFDNEDQAWSHIRHLMESPKGKR